MPEEKAQTENIYQETQPEAVSETTKNIESIGRFLSLYGMILFFIAIIIDLIGLVFFFLSFVGVGIPLSWILDVVGLVFVGGLMLLSPSGDIVVTSKSKKITKKVAKKLGKRLGLSFLVEIIPLVGDAAPCWTLAVYFHLKNG